MATSLMQYSMKAASVVNSHRKDRGRINTFAGRDIIFSALLFQLVFDVDVVCR